MFRRVAVLAAHIAGLSPPSTEEEKGKASDKEDEEETTQIARIQAVPPRVLVISPEVQSALASGKAVVALESTIITHGMPYPENLTTARAVEQIVRGAGACPATVAIIKGVPHVGLSDAQLQQLAITGTKAQKCSRRDIGRCIALGLDGATTVSGTMVLAAAAGVRVFVTGGIGGVHRGGESSMDVSADLDELGRTPVLVVCAGVKSILDIPRTLEYLETKGVCTAALRSDHFPAFFMRDSGVAAPCRFDSELDVATAFKAQLEMNLRTGMVLGVPIPGEHEARGAKVQSAIEQALRESDQQHVAGRDITPFLLKRIAELSDGESLRSNVALVKNNAAVGARIAVALAQLEKDC